MIDIVYVYCGYPPDIVLLQHSHSRSDIYWHISLPVHAVVPNVACKHKR